MTAGRPWKYKTEEELQAAIDGYFKSCEGEILKDKDGSIIYNKYGEPAIVNDKPCTVTDMALYLGFNSRQALLNYQDRKEFNDAITRAKSRIEAYAERRLYDKDGCNGAKFNLANNFGWREKQEIESTNLNLNKDVSQLSDEELDAELKKYGK